jgi:hypothetical protein
VEQIVSGSGTWNSPSSRGLRARRRFRLIDLVLVGEIDRTYLDSLVGKLEEIIRRKIRTLVLSVDELEPLRSRLGASRSLIVWNAGSRRPERLPLRTEEQKPRERRGEDKKLRVGGE